MVDESTSAAGLPVGDAVKEAFIVSWKYKWFWPLAFLTYPQIMGTDFLYPSFESMPDTTVLISVAVAFLAFVLFISFAAALLQPTLIIAVDSYRRGFEPRMKDCLRSAVDYFWKVWLLELVWLAIILGGVVLFAVPVGVAMAINPVIGVLTIAFLLLVLIVIALIVIPVANYSYRHLVLRGTGIFDSLTAAYQTFLSMKGRSLGLMVATLAIGFCAFMVVYIPVTILQLVLQVSEASESIVFIAFYLPVALVLSTVFIGYFQAFTIAAWTLVFPYAGDDAVSAGETTSAIDYDPA